MLATINQPNVTAYSSTDKLAAPCMELVAGDSVHLGETVKRNGKEWVKVRDNGGNVGYIEGKTRVRLSSGAQREVAGKNMLHGALWCIGGVIVTVGTYSAAGPGDTYFIAWGAILFGSLQFLKGFFQYISS
jgi:hypothetical protein